MERHCIRVEKAHKILHFYVKVLSMLRSPSLYWHPTITNFEVSAPLICRKSSNNLPISFPCPELGTICPKHVTLVQGEYYHMLFFHLSAISFTNLRLNQRFLFFVEIYVSSKQILNSAPPLYLKFVSQIFFFLSTFRPVYDVISLIWYH